MPTHPIKTRVRAEVHATTSMAVTDDGRAHLCREALEAPEAMGGGRCIRRENPARQGRPLRQYPQPDPRVRVCGDASAEWSDHLVRLWAGAALGRTEDQTGSRFGKPTDRASQRRLVEGTAFRSACFRRI